MDKYIKRINWPWVEVFDNFVPGGETIAINMDEVSMIWARNDTKYVSGIQLKNGTWIQGLSSAAIKEVQELRMTHALMV